LARKHESCIPIPQADGNCDGRGAQGDPIHSIDFDVQIGHGK
jgi:hypothetical protein